MNEFDEDHLVEQLNAICRKFEDRWSPESRPDFEPYLRQVDDPYRSRLLQWLLEADIELRQAAGQIIDPNDYSQVGVDSIELVRQILGGESIRTKRQLSGNANPATHSFVSNQLQIGPYKLLEKLGEGGMGAVWIAQQDHPVKRRVALKLIKPGIGSREILSRFDAERQALALMDHSNIARILDASATETGQPYFVMELVIGTPLTTYCDDNRLSIDERLKLFTDVCAGVQHAHQKGIIHRDLKPGNIIVGMQDGQPVPKIIDFGLAKAMEHMSQLTEESLMTGIGQILGTLKYMSPEQASLNPIDIDTRTDIYALGVILYELLTGSTPLDDSSMKGQDILKVLEAIRDKEPVKPSSKLSTFTAETKSSITNERRTDTLRLNRILAGDLDWVVMKALEKDRTRRYASASGFAVDVQRYLSSEPVVARPPSLNYRIGKFVRKNRAGVIAVSLVAGALLAGILGTSWGMVLATRRAEGERIAKNAESIALEKETQQRILAEDAKVAALEAAEKERLAKVQSQLRLVQIEKSNEILGSIFEDLDIQTVKDWTEPLEAVLANRLVGAGKQLEGEAIGDPLVVATLQDRLGSSLTSLGFPGDAIKLVLQAVNTRKANLGTDHPDTLFSMVNLAGAYDEAGEFDQAIPLFKQTLELMRTNLGTDHPSTLGCMNDLGAAYRSAGELDKALPLWQQTLEMMKANLGTDHRDTLICMGNLASAHHDTGEFDQAIPLFEQTLKLMKNKLGADHPVTLTGMNNLALGYIDAGELKKALPLLEQSLELSKAKRGADHPKTLGCMNDLAVAYRTAGELDKAIPLYEQTLEMMKSKLGANNPSTLTSMSNLALAYRTAGEFDRAIPLFKQTLELMRSKLGTDHPSTLGCMNNLALGYLDAGELDKALPLFEQTLELSKAKLGTDHPDTLNRMNGLAGTYQAVGKVHEALKLYKHALEIMKTKLGADHPDTLRCMNNLATAYDATGELDKALSLSKQTLEMTKTKQGADHPDTLNRMSNLAAFYRAAGEFEKALPLYEQTLKMRKAELGSDHPDTLTSMDGMACGYFAAGELEKALPLFETSLEMRKARLGPDHPDTLTSMNNLAAAYRAAGELDKALSLLEQALEMRKAKLGSDHPDTLNSMNGLAATYWSAGKLDKSVPLFEELVQLHVQKLGENHTATLRTLANLGVNYRDAGRIDEGIAALEEVVTKISKVPTLAWTRASLRSAYITGKRKESFAKMAEEDLTKARELHESGSLELAGKLASLGNDWLTIGDPVAAEPLLRECLDIRQLEIPEEWRAFSTPVLLGESLVGQEKWDEAQPLLEAGYAGLKATAKTIPASVRRKYLTQALDNLIALATSTEDTESLNKWTAERATYEPNKTTQPETAAPTDADKN